MADLRDDQGRPIQLTDELGRPVQLTDEHGVPIHLTGVATTAHGGGTTTIGSELRDKTAHDSAATMGSKTHGGTHFAPTPVDYVKRGGEAVAAAVTGGGGGAPASHTQAHGGGEQKKPLERASSSSSSSSEDDGQGGRRKKKGLKQKIKEKLPGHNGHGENETSKGAAHSIDTKATSTTTGVAATATGQQHQKKGFIDKIKDKLPGHHH